MSLANNIDNDRNLHDGNHKAAISLNNIGVSLLVRGHLLASLETFKDAVKAMRCSTASSWGGEMEVALALDRANKRNAIASSSGIMTSSMQGWLSLQVITTQENPTHVYQVLTSPNVTGNPTSEVAFAMKIDPIASDDYTVDDVALEAGVVLYNYGLAFECLAARPFHVRSSMEDTAMQETARCKSHRMFHLAIAVLSKLDYLGFVSSPNGATLSNQLLLLRTVMMHNLIHTSIMMNHETEYHQYSQAMQRLLQAVELQQLLLPMADRNVAAAA